MLYANILVLCFATAVASAQTINYRLAVTNRDPVPGFSPDTTFSDISRFVLGLNDSGRIVFLATPFGPDLNALNNEMIFRVDPGELPVIVAREGDQAPGLPDGVQFSSFNSASIQLDDSGLTSFIATLKGVGVDATNDSGLFGPSDSESLTAIARTGDQAVGLTPGTTYFGFDHVMNPQGEILVRCTLQPAPPNPLPRVAIFTNAGRTSLEPVAVEGEQAGGLPDGVRYGPSMQVLNLNASGQFLFYSQVEGPDVDSSNRFAFFRSLDSQSVQSIVRAGDQAAGLPSGVVYNQLNFNNIQFSSKGDTAFSASLNGGKVNSTNNSAFFRQAQDGVSFSVIAREDEQAPGLPQGVRYNQLGGLRVGPQGRVHITSSLRGTNVNSQNNGAAFSELGDEPLTLLNREGDAVPGLPDGITFTGGNALRRNAIGQQLISAGLRGYGSSAIAARLLLDDTGNYQIVLREGQVIDISQDPKQQTPRTIEDIEVVDVFNDSGELALLVDFSIFDRAILVATIRSPCSIADLVEPFGAINFFDIAAFIKAFAAEDPRADLAEPFGSFNFFDISSYLSIFSAGCP